MPDPFYVADRPLADGRSLFYKIERKLVGKEPVISIAHVAAGDDGAEEQRAAVVIEYDLLDQLIDGLTAFMPAKAEAA